MSGNRAVTGLASSQHNLEQQTARIGQRVDLGRQSAA